MTHCTESYADGWDAGRASRDAEVDKLKLKAELLKVALETSEGYLKQEREEVKAMEKFRNEVINATGNKALADWIEKHGRPVPMQQEIDSLQAEVEALKTELTEANALHERLADILTRSANLIRGEPEPLSLHSWHDLPELIEALRADAERLDWLNNNFYSRENLDWITGKVCNKNNMWVFFAPTGPQGNIRTVLDAARKEK